MKSLCNCRTAVSWTACFRFLSLVMLLLIFVIIVFPHGSSVTRNSSIPTTITSPGGSGGSSDDMKDDSDNDNSMLVKVFILAGQSNMVGMAAIEHLHELINVTTRDDYTGNDNSCDANEYCQDLWNEKTNGFQIRQNVFMKYNDVYGNLTVGHGFAANDRFGPELGFGWVMGDAAAAPIKPAEQEHPVYIIKAAWGGRSLAVDFRPPASGEGNYPSIKPHVYGWEYREMMATIEDGLNQIATVVPGYVNNSSRFEIAGFVWFQGWNDMISLPFVEEYGYNLANLMRDIRKELDAPHLPMVVGELGMHGANYHGQGADRVLRMRAAQKAATLLPEFRSSSRFVPTTPYVVLNDTKTYGGNYHYNGRADTYYHIGKAFGRAMLALLAENEFMAKQQSLSS
jgi:hypothetical protein